VRTETLLEIPDAITRKQELARRNWGRWGGDDERGTLNLLGPAEVKAAAGLVRLGETLPLAQELDRKTPTSPRRPAPAHFMHRDGGDYLRAGDPPPRAQFSDDSMLLALHTATHVDALAHVWHGEELYNGFSRETVTSTGAHRCGAETLGPIVGRGILLDVPAALGVDVLPVDHAVRVEELERCLELAKLELHPADIVLIRTGWWSACAASESTFACEPGPDLDTACWLADQDVAAVGADNFAFELLPSGFDDFVFPVHELLLRDCGMPIFEGLALDDLAQRGIYEFMFVAAPLPIVGGTASPLNPVALV